MLKSKLLQTGVFIDNVHLDSYVSIVEEGLYKKHKKDVTERHHILPVSYFKNNSISVDNTKTNIAILTHFSHLLAHYHLCFCTTSYLKEAMIYAFNLMTYENYSLLNANEKFLYEQLEYVAELRKEAAKQRSETQMSLETRAKIAPTWFVKGQDPWNKGVPCKESTRFILREYNLKNPSKLTEDGRRRIAEANSHPKDAETVEKMKQYANSRTPEHLQNLADSARGKTHAFDGTKNRWWKKDTPLPDGWCWGWR